MPAVEQDLTQGSVTRKLVRYALPLVASSLPPSPVSSTTYSTPASQNTAIAIPNRNSKNVG